MQIAPQQGDEIGRHCRRLTGSEQASRLRPSKDLSPCYPVRLAAGGVERTRQFRLFAGGGYTTELLSRVVGPTGTVYSQEPVFPPESQQIEQAWSTRLAQPTFKNVIGVHKSFGSDDLLPAKPGSLDAIIINMNYHDLVLLGVDRDKLNAEMFRALKSGSVYGIVDHSAKNGSGLKDISLHRIDEGLLVEEVQKAGFRLAAASSALRHPEDDRTWVTAPRAAGERRGTSDRFMLRFVKP